MDTAILTALVAGATALLVAALTNYLAKARERESDWRRMKLERYREYVSSLSGTVEGRSTAEAHRRYADAVNELQLVAPPEVLGALQRFLAHTSYRNPDKDLERHDELFNELIKAMRGDLWPKARSNNSGRQFWLQAVPPATKGSK